MHGILHSGIAWLLGFSNDLKAVYHLCMTCFSLEDTDPSSSITSNGTVDFGVVADNPSPFTSF